MQRRHSRRVGAIAGAAAGAVALGVGEFVAGLGRAFASPVVALADTVIRYLPPGVKQPAVELLGQGDKPFLVATIVLVTLAVTALLGIRALRRVRAGVTGFAVLTLLATLAVVDSPRSGIVAALPAAVAGVVGIAVLLRLVARAREEGSEVAADEGRRSVLRAAAGIALLGVVAGLVGRWLQQKVTIASKRLALELPTPAETIDLPVAEAAHPAVDGLPPAVTPNDRFYRIDTAFSVPQIDPATHVVRVTGMVDEELSIPFSDLLTREMVEFPSMLACVSNEVGGDLVDTAVWRGVLLRDVLDDAGVSRDADQVVGRSVDGWTCGFPVSVAYDRPAILAVGMNGEPLPAQHGFPVRLVTPGLYGYVSATKWLAEIELTSFDRFDQYWVRRGWAERAPIKAQSRIDVPARDSRIVAGTVPVAGVAWAPLGGVGRVEVRIDDGPWEHAELAAAINGMSWRQWVYRWDAAPGNHRIAVRATDTNGDTQTNERVPPKPDGATGWHTIAVDVSDA